MSKVLKQINSISIGAKIFLGFLLIFIIFIIQYLFFLDSFKSIENHVVLQRKLSDNTTVIMSINKDISELQRLTLSYSITGSDSILLKLKKIYNETLDKTKKIKRSILDEENVLLVRNMEKVVEHYGENIGVLKKRYSFRESFIYTKLPEISLRGELILKKLSHKYKDIKYLQMIWMKINMHSIYYFQTRKYLEQKRVISELNEFKYWSSNNINNRKDQLKLKSIAQEYLATFKKAIQANRVYLSLVNVVMAGDSLEFTTLSNKLRENSLRRAELLARENTEEIEKTKHKGKITILVTGSILIFIIIFYINNISKAIKGISSVFNEFIEGRMDSEIPGLNRGDEIGVLAKAADRFKQLNQKYEMQKIKAQKLAKIKSDFLANMSHEIRTPMNGILGMIELLKDTEINEMQDEMLESISSSGESLSRILNDILDLSKMESGKIKFEEVSFDLNKVVKEIEPIYKGLAQDKGLRFCYRLNHDEPVRALLGDSTRIKQVLTNLLSNSLKFTSRGLIHLFVHYKELNNDYAEVNFSVKDTGVGMSEEKLQKVFDSFSQADSSITRKYGGTGLGLTISKNIVELMESKIDVISEAGKGTTFSFKLILKIDHHATEVLPIPRSKDVSFAKDKKVLLVEDNEINIKVAKARLLKTGLSVEVARNGEEAVKACSKNQYDLILMDMQMPIMDGISATLIIKKNGKNKETPIAAMTANVMSEDRDKCFAAGMEYFVPKPINKKELYSVLEQVLK